MCLMRQFSTVQSHTSRQSARIILSNVRSRFCGVASWHSQILKTRHPAARSARVLRVSRFLLLSNLAFQNSLRVPGMRPFWQPCACQKQPCTKTTEPYFGRTKSGRPGRSRRCRRKRNPRACNHLRTNSSGLVCAPRMRDIRSLLSSGVKVSAMGHLHPVGELNPGGACSVFDY